MTQRQEHISLAYVRAVAAHAGCTCLATEAGADFGQDLQINHIALYNDKPAQDGNLIQIQVKSTTNAEINDGHVVYKLEAKDYNRLVRKSANPRILVLYRMPKAHEDWVKVTADMTSLAHCAYWLHLAGQPPTENKETFTIRIPLDNVFDTAAVVALMRRVITDDLT